MTSARAYRFEPGEPVPDAVRAVARGRIDHAVAELDGRAGRDPGKAVHNARKDIKRLRALLRLVRSELGKQVIRTENARLRDAAAQLAARRDADVMIATLASLELEPDAGAGLGAALRAHRLRTSGGAAEPAAQAAMAALGEMRLSVDDWPLRRCGFGALRPGLERMYRRGRAGYRRTAAEPTVEGIHEWRKRVKDLWYQHQLLDHLWPAAMGAVAGEAHELSDRLGDDHDLAVLAAWAREHAVGGPELEAAVEERRARLQREALELGGRLYAERPRDFVRRLERLWDAA